MFKRTIGLLILAFAFLALPGRAQAQCSIGGFAPGAFVSSFSGHQILCVDGTSGTTTVIFTGTSSFFPEDLVVGPDGKLYVADSLSNRVWRMNQDGSAAEVIYDKSTAICKDSSGTTTVLCPSDPEGPSFSGSDDLYFNTRGPNATGVWKIAGVAASSPPAPLTVQQVIPLSASAFGEGTTFSFPGNLLAVDQAGNRVLSSSPPYVSASNLITGLSKPFGAAVNTCGEVLVTSGGSISRFDATTGSFLGTYVSFSKGDIPRYIEVDSANRLFVVTAKDDSGSNGKVWRVDPVLTTGDPITSCALGLKTLLVSLKAALSGPGAVSGLATDQALGLAVPATNFTITHTYNPGSNVGNLYNFGPHSFSVKYKQVFTTFCQTFTALKSRPADISFTNPLFATDTVGTRYSSDGGFVIEYKAEDTQQCPLSIGGTQYAASTPGTHDAIQIKIGFFTQDVFLTPGLARAPNDNVVYSEDVSHDFWAAAGPEIDPVQGGNTDGFSKHVVFNRKLKQAGIFTLKEPVLSGNPQFKQGQSIRVAFTLTDTSGNAIPNAIARLSILRINPTPAAVQKVVSKNNVNSDNFFNAGTSGNLYTYTVDSLFLQPGSHQFTIFSNSFAPQSFNVLIVQ